ncbi:unnamed protein product [Choristocarpus tenellus]
MVTSVDISPVKRLDSEEGEKKEGEVGKVVDPDLKGQSDGGIVGAGLANITLPLPSFLLRPPSLEEPEDESEDEFHDAVDSMLGLTKDAAKAHEMKELGNSHYKAREFRDAMDYYTMALEFSPEDEESKEDRAVYLSNRAACQLQLSEV